MWVFGSLRTRVCVCECAIACVCVQRTLVEIVPCNVRPPTGHSHADACEPPSFENKQRTEKKSEKGKRRSAKRKGKPALHPDGPKISSQE